MNWGFDGFCSFGPFGPNEKSSPGSPGCVTVDGQVSHCHRPREIMVYSDNNQLKTSFGFVMFCLNLWYIYICTYNYTYIYVLCTVTPVMAVVAIGYSTIMIKIIKRLLLLTLSDREEDRSVEQPKAGQEERREFRAFRLRVSLGKHRFSEEVAMKRRVRRHMIMKKMRV